MQDKIYLDEFDYADLHRAYNAIWDSRLAAELEEEGSALLSFLVDTNLQDKLISYIETGFKEQSEEEELDAAGYQIIEPDIQLVEVQEVEAPKKKKGEYPKITPEDINKVITDEYYHVVPGTSMTICVLTLKNGFQVTGESASASIENFDKDLGRKLSKAKAMDKVWMLEGYLLKEKMWWEEVLVLQQSQEFGDILK